jgi:hypothetical protein
MSLSGNRELNWNENQGSIYSRGMKIYNEKPAVRNLFGLTMQVHPPEPPIIPASKYLNTPTKSDFINCTEYKNFMGSVISNIKLTGFPSQNVTITINIDSILNNNPYVAPLIDSVLFEKMGYFNKVDDLIEFFDFANYFKIDSEKQLPVGLTSEHIIQSQAFKDFIARLIIELTKLYLARVQKVVYGTLGGSSLQKKTRIKKRSKARKKTKITRKRRVHRKNTRNLY